MIDVRSHWNFGNPAGSRGRFEELERCSDGEEKFVWQTQIARTHGLEKNFDEAHAVLDAIEPDFVGVSAFAQSYFLLERGRVFNSSGKKEEALRFFERAADLRVPGLGIDAMHMVAIAQSDSDLAIKKNEEALALAEASEHEEDRRWRASLLNNLGWGYHDANCFDLALGAFERALALRTEAGDPATTNIAKWCVGRCLRSLERFDEAYAIQSELRDAVPDDQYVLEELVELEKVMP